MLIFFNEASLQGQFRDEEEFRVLLEKLLSARRRSPCFANMRTTHALADRKVLHSRSFRQVVQSWRGMKITRLVMAWVAKNGPFIENDRTPEEEDLFSCLGVEVTDGGLGEAARRTKASEDVASVSLQGGATDFAITPLPVVHGFEDEPIAKYPIENYWDIDVAVKSMLGRGDPASNWREMVETARARFPALVLPESLWENKGLTGQPFNARVRDQTYELLDILNKYMCGRDEWGVEQPAAQEILRDNFKSKKFSTESKTNKETFRNEMTFPDPEGGDKIFAPWHGKISHRYFRIHFEWPVPKSQKQLKVLYVGPKLTKS